MLLNIQIDLLILKTHYGQFTLTTKKSLHIIFKWHTTYRIVPFPIISSNLKNTCCRPLQVRSFVQLLGSKKGFPYSLSSVGPGADPGVQAVSPQVTIGHPPGGRLPLLSARPAVTFPAVEHHRPLAVLSYTAWWQRHIGVNNLPKVVRSITPCRIWTHDLLIASPTFHKLHHLATCWGVSSPISRLRTRSMQPSRRFQLAWSLVTVNAVLKHCRWQAICLP